MLVALATSASVATAIEHAIIPEAIVGAVDSLPGRLGPGPARHDGVMEALVRVITGSPERRHGMMCRCLRSPQQRKHGGDRYDRCAQQPSPRVSGSQHPGQTIKSPIIHQTPLQSRCGRSTWSSHLGSPAIRATRR